MATALLASSPSPDPVHVYSVLKLGQQPVDQPIIWAANSAVNRNAVAVVTHFTTFDGEVIQLEPNEPFPTDQLDNAREIHAVVASNDSKEHVVLKQFGHGSMDFRGYCGCQYHLTPYERQSDGTIYYRSCAHIGAVLFELEPETITELVIADAKKQDDLKVVTLSRGDRLTPRQRLQKAR